MAAPFAALEARVNRAVFARLSNAATTLAGLPVDGIFDKSYELASGGLAGMASTAPVFTLPTSAVPINPVGRALVISGVAYTVVEHQPDGTGVSLLLLEKA